jgi:CheY-like chemotaxis protein
MILCILDDLFFRSRIEAAATNVGASIAIAGTLVALQERLRQSGWRVAVLDLNAQAFDPIEALAEIHRIAPALPVLAFFSHVQVELRQRAREAGCAWVVPRSAFVQLLPRLLHGELPPTSQ